MAIPVEYREFTPKDARADLMHKLETAPREHAEALLGVYELIQRMHDKGVIQIANGLLSASDTVVERLSDVVASKPAVNGLRLALMLSNLLGSVDADKVHAVLALSDAKPPSLWRLAREATSEEARRGMAKAVGLLKVFGSKP